MVGGFWFTASKVFQGPCQSV